MRKKVIGLTIVGIVAISGVVSAASIWGSYKGNDIVRLTVDGDPVNVSDVPAINYNNRTMIPINLLKQAGINYTWDGSNRTVDIIPPQQQVITKTVTVPSNDGVGSTDYLASLHNYNIVDVTEKSSIEDGNSVSYVSLSYNGKLSSMGDDIYTNILSTMATSTNVYLFISFTDGYMYGLDISDLKNWATGKITSDSFSKLITLYPPENNTSTQATNTNSSSNSYDPTKCQQIKDDAARRGGLDSGGVQYQLQMAGCPIN